MDMGSSGGRSHRLRLDTLCIYHDFKCTIVNPDLEDFKPGRFAAESG